jgi:hypothetical protein
LVEYLQITDVTIELSDILPYDTITLSHLQFSGFRMR